MTTLRTIIIMIITHHPTNIEAVDCLQITIVRQHSKDSIKEVEARKLNTADNHFPVKDFKDEFIREIEANT